MGAEIIAQVTEHRFDKLKCPPKRLGFPDCPTPTSPALAVDYYPRADHLVRAVHEMLGEPVGVERDSVAKGYLDIPDPSFTGPF